MPPIDEYMQEFLNDPKIPDEQKNGVRALWESNLTAGKKLEIQGKFREALTEFIKEHGRIINTSSDAEIVQNSYYFTGAIYWKLEETENALDDFQKALELFRLYKVGIAPHENLAIIYVHLGHYDDAIALCEEYLKQSPAWSVKKLLERALDMRNDQNLGKS